MIRHIVLIKFSSELDAAQIQERLQAIVALKDKIGGILSITAGENSSPENLEKDSGMVSSSISRIVRRGISIFRIPNTRRSAKASSKQPKAVSKAYWFSTTRFKAPARPPPCKKDRRQKAQSLPSGDPAPGRGCFRGRCGPIRGGDNIFAVMSAQNQQIAGIDRHADAQDFAACHTDRLRHDIRLVGDRRGAENHDYITGWADFGDCRRKSRLVVRNAFFANKHPAISGSRFSINSRVFSRTVSRIEGRRDWISPIRAPLKG